MSKRWYVVHAYSGFESQVKRSLEERIARAGMQDLFGEVVPGDDVAAVILTALGDGDLDLVDGDRTCRVWFSAPLETAANLRTVLAEMAKAQMEAKQAAPEAEESGAEEPEPEEAPALHAPQGDGR